MPWPLEPKSYLDNEISGSRQKEVIFSDKMNEMPVSTMFSLTRQVSSVSRASRLLSAHCRSELRMNINSEIQAAKLPHPLNLRNRMFCKNSFTMSIRLSLACHDCLVIYTMN